VADGLIQFYFERYWFCCQTFVFVADTAIEQPKNICIHIYP